MPTNIFGLSTATDDAAVFDIAHNYGIGENFTWLVPSGGPFITGAPQSKTLTEGETVLLQAQATMIAGSLDSTAVLNTKYVGQTKTPTAIDSPTMEELWPGSGGIASETILHQMNVPVKGLTFAPTGNGQFQDFPVDGGREYQIAITPIPTEPFSIQVDDAEAIPAVGNYDIAVDRTITDNVSFPPNFPSVVTVEDRGVERVIKFTSDHTLSQIRVFGNIVGDAGQPVQMSGVIAVDRGVTRVKGIPHYRETSGYLFMAEAFSIPTTVGTGIVVSDTNNVLGEKGSTYAQHWAAVLNDQGDVLITGDGTRRLGWYVNNLTGLINIGSNSDNGNSYHIMDVATGALTDSLHATPQNTDFTIENHRSLGTGGVYFETVLHGTSSQYIRVGSWLEDVTTLAWEGDFVVCSMNNETPYLPPPVTMAAVGDLNTISVPGDPLTVTASFQIGTPTWLQVGLSAGNQIDPAVMPVLDFGTVHKTEVLSGLVLATLNSQSSTVTFGVKVAASAKTLNFVAEYPIPNDGALLDLNTSVLLTTGLDFTIPNAEIRFVTNDNNSILAQFTQVSQPGKVTYTEPQFRVGYQYGVTSGLIDCQIADAAAAAIGQIRVDASTTCYGVSIQLFTTSPRAFNVPDSFTALISHDITVTGGTGTINDVGTLTVFEGQNTQIKFGLNADQQVDTIVGSVSGVLVGDYLNGVFNYTPPAGPDETFALTEKPYAFAEGWKPLATYVFNEANPAGAGNMNAVGGVVGSDGNDFYTMGFPFEEGDEFRIITNDTNVRGSHQKATVWMPVVFTVSDTAMKIEYDLNQSAGTTEIFNCRVDDAAMAALGKIKINPSTTCYPDRIEWKTKRPKAFQVSQAHTALVPRTITQVGGLGTFHNGTATTIRFEGADSILRLGTDDGFQVLTATSTLLGTLNVHTDGIGNYCDYIAGNADDTVTVVQQQSSVGMVDHIVRRVMLPGAFENTWINPLGLTLLVGDLTGIDFLVFELSTAGSGVRVQEIKCSMSSVPGNSEMMMNMNNTTANVYYNLDVNADLTLGSIVVNGGSGTVYCRAIQVGVRKSTAHSIPAGLVAGNVVAMSGDSGGPKATPIGEVRQGYWSPVELELDADMMLDLASDPTVTAVGGRVKHANPWGGIVNVWIPPGQPLTDTITYVQKLQPVTNITRTPLGGTVNLHLSAATTAWNSQTSGSLQLPLNGIVDINGMAIFKAVLNIGWYGPAPQVFQRITVDGVEVAINKLYNNQASEYMMSPVYLESEPIAVTVGQVYQIEVRSTNATIHNMQAGANNADSWLQIERLN